MLLWSSFTRWTEIKALVNQNINKYVFVLSLFLCWNPRVSRCLANWLLGDCCNFGGLNYDYFKGRPPWLFCFDAIFWQLCSTIIERPNLVSMWKSEKATDSHLTSHMPLMWTIIFIFYYCPNFRRDSHLISGCYFSTEIPYGTIMWQCQSRGVKFDDTRIIFSNEYISDF